MARSGQRVEAIKLLRQATHLDLSTAKNYIERL
jgi:ribosomal protein L7/L12